LPSKGLNEYNGPVLIDRGLPGKEWIFVEIIDSDGYGFSTSLKGFKRGEGEASSLFNRLEYVFGACAVPAL